MDLFKKCIIRITTSTDSRTEDTNVKSLSSIYYNFVITENFVYSFKGRNKRWRN